MSHKMTQEDKARIQKTQFEGGKDVGKGSFAASAQSAADKHTHAASLQQGNQGGQSGQGGNQGQKK